MSRITLPIFLTRQNKYAVGLVAAVIAAALYLFTNHLHFLEPQLLPMWALDRAIPFVPQMVWIYISEYIFFTTVYLTCKDITNTNKYLYSFLALQTVSVLIFIFWPTTYPRDQFPLVASEMDSWTYYAFNSLRTSDSPASCCPSLHVSSVYLSAFVFLDDQRRKFPFFFLWGTAIALSTLPTKQHYVIDVVTGFVMAVLFYWVFHRWVAYEPISSKRSGSNIPRSARTEAP